MLLIGVGAVAVVAGALNMGVLLLTELLKRLGVLEGAPKADVADEANAGVGAECGARGEILKMAGIGGRGILFVDCVTGKFVIRFMNDADEKNILKLNKKSLALK